MYIFIYEKNTIMNKISSTEFNQKYEIDINCKRSG